MCLHYAVAGLTKKKLKAFGRLGVPGSVLCQKKLACKPAGESVAGREKNQSTHFNSAMIHCIGAAPAVQEELQKRIRLQRQKGDPILLGERVERTHWTCQPTRMCWGGVRVWLGGGGGRWQRLRGGRAIREHVFI